ncbi:bifunctional enoyl-CoA hydratase/phosphate acetyltransferase [Aureimonas sp. AU4]|uniref:bifunctional enoyl-CoA hydratase/phosphate acetyltransferase n=1 Tax=Aureimonas sp. AU4 TaxID=1638163 RepID=UPI000780BC08|nr:bifunctional enoyl-CoA hydratase/phosphate acetyltransferase [Aureimonas sp. AU4]
MDRIENRTFDEVRIGDAASLTRTLTGRDVALFALASGDIEPAPLREGGAGACQPLQGVGQNLWSGALVAAVLETELPGPGTLYLGQTLRFGRPVEVGDSVTATVRVVEKHADRRRVVRACTALNQRGETVVEGEAEVIAPLERISCERAMPPEIEFRRPGRQYERLIDLAKGLSAIRTAVVHPVDATVLAGAAAAAAAGIVVPVFVGPEKRIRAAAKTAGIDVSRFELVATEHSHAAAAAAASLARDRKVEALMKGSLHTDEFMAAILDEPLLRTGRRMSHVFVVDAPRYPRPLLLTDAAVNIAPTLGEKRDIVLNAIDLAHVLAVPEPRVAILSAVETVNEKLRSTLDAAALCKMADRGQICGAILDGPLAFDNAVSAEAASAKGIVSPVAGRADILVVPDIEAGNMLAKQLEYLAEAQVAGVVLGARVPVILTSRADKTLARLASCAVARLLAHARRTPAPADAMVASHG